MSDSGGQIGDRHEDFCVQCLRKERDEWKAKHDALWLKISTMTPDDYRAMRESLEYAEIMDQRDSLRALVGEMESKAVSERVMVDRLVAKLGMVLHKWESDSFSGDGIYDRTLFDEAEALIKQVLTARACALSRADEATKTDALPVEVMIDARQDTVHTDIGISRPGKSARVDEATKGEVKP